jgi:hypothetical protein
MRPGAIPFGQDVAQVGLDHDAGGLKAGEIGDAAAIRSTLKDSSPNSRVMKPVGMRAMARPTSAAASTAQERLPASRQNGA